VRVFVCVQRYGGPTCGDVGPIRKVARLCDWLQRSLRTLSHKYREIEKERTRAREREREKKRERERDKRTPHTHPCPLPLPPPMWRVHICVRAWVSATICLYVVSVCAWMRRGIFMCVRVCVNNCIYIYIIHIYKYICIYAYIYTYICMYIYVYTSLCI